MKRKRHTKNTIIVSRRTGFGSWVFFRLSLPDASAVVAGPVSGGSPCASSLPFFVSSISGSFEVCAAKQRDQGYGQLYDAKDQDSQRPVVGTRDTREYKIDAEQHGREEGDVGDSLCK
jgi:hypothetical protein